MKLKDLVGKMAIRTKAVRTTEKRILGDSMDLLSYGFNVSPYNPADEDIRYMNIPIKVIAVEEELVAIEDHGVNKLLERKYIDEYWTDYNKLMYPEEEISVKSNSMIKEIKEAAAPLRKLLEKYYDPMVKVVVDTERVELQTLFSETIRENEEQ